MVVASLQKVIKEQLNLSAGRMSVALEVEGEKFEYNSREVLPSASLIKIPILIAAYKESEKGVLFLHHPIKVPARARVGGAGVIQALSEGLTLTVKDLLTLMIIVSDNTAANLCIDLIGLDSINRTIKDLGLEHTILGRKMMDWDAIGRGQNNYTSASDMLYCLKAMKEGSYLSEDSKGEIVQILQAQQFTDKLPALMDLDQVTVANKTGELPGVEHDCAIISYKGKTAYAAVLTDGLQNKKEGRQVISRIGKAIFDYLVES